MQGKLKSCLEMYEKDPNEGYKYLLRLIFASQIRSLNHLHEQKIKDVPDDIDERYKTYLKGRNATTQSINRDLEHNRNRYAGLLEKIKDYE